VSETLGMAQHEVTRTLVKSQPEIWTQCSDPDSLGRHLSGSFGEIRITRLEPEHSVAWEGEEVSGTVRIEPSAWGTRVTMAVEVEGEPVVAQVEEEPAAPQPAEEPVTAETDEAPTAPQPDHGQMVSALTAAGGGAPAQSTPPRSTPPPAQEPDEAPPKAETEPPRSPGLFARVWGRFRRPSESPAEPEADGPDEPEHSEEPEAPEQSAAPEPIAAPEPEPQSEPEPIAEPEMAAHVPIEVTAQSVSEPEPAEVQNHPVAALNAALESLGQAHHRPFSRA
jgi:hypothetical protein